MTVAILALEGNFDVDGLRAGTGAPFQTAAVAALIPLQLGFSVTKAHFSRGSHLVDAGFDQAGTGGARRRARSVYKTNDERAALKRAINEAVGSEIVEEKSYAKYE